MLTEAGYSERCWGKYPALRKALESDGTPYGGSRFSYGYSSVSDTMFEEIQRMVGIVNLVNERRQVLLDLAQTEGPDVVYQDLLTLKDGLTRVGRAISNIAEETGESLHPILNDLLKLRSRK